MASKLAIQGGTKVRTKPYPKWPMAGKEEEDALIRVLRSGTWGCTQGSEVGKFEAAFAKYQDAKHGIAVVNGTVSLRLALMASGIQAGDEVIVPPYTFLATASSVVEANGTPVFVDIHPDTYNLDPDKIEAAITPRTRAIIPVHVAGLAADMDRILAIARRRNLTVIEDCAHAHGATYKGRKVGAIGDMGSFSFQSSKNLTSGEGGIILSDNDTVAAMCRSLHNCGRVEGGTWYGHRNPGGNYRMTEFQGALLSCQLVRLEEQAVTRDANGLYLDKKLAEIPGLQPMARGRFGETRHAYHLYMFRYDPDTFGGATREAFCKAVSAEGVPCCGGYPVPLYRQPLFAEKHFGPFTGYRSTRPEMDYANVSCPVCEQACKAACWITQSVLLGSRADMDDIVAAVAKVYENRAELASVR
ncbi:MAG: aminotransferase DegT [Lentisphaerae bacterium RIFOXYB12_FULL_65_16]|nr:MAG: aminotransferase DegT [Lentisphaerae bacterium RIFOXYA12_64_32]OGV91617.1 MAG: aminotransferase DegT [Lentisphaerae bacterium RIFOXYB12_FULL_65_16]